MANRKLLARRCSVTPAKEYYWDYDARAALAVDYTASSCAAYNLPKGTLLDSWYEGAKKVEVFTVWDGSGRPPRTAEEYVTKVYTDNAPGGGVTPCGLKIDDVVPVREGESYRITILTSGYDGEVEYSLNQFVDVQTSNEFSGLTPGDYTAYARAKR